MPRPPQATGGLFVLSGSEKKDWFVIATDQGGRGDTAYARALCGNGDPYGAVMLASRKRWAYKFSLRSEAEKARDALAANFKAWTWTVEPL